MGHPLVGIVKNIFISAGYRLINVALQLFNTPTISIKLKMLTTNAKICPFTFQLFFPRYFKVLLSQLSSPRQKRE